MASPQQTSSDAPSTTQTPRRAALRKSAWWPLLWIAAPGFLVDGFLTSVSAWAARESGPSLAGQLCDAAGYAAVGFVVAQLVLLNFGIVFGHESLELRLVRGSWLAVIGYLCWLLGIATFQIWNPSTIWGIETVGWHTAYLVPVICCMIQLPFWIARAMLGWRFIRTDQIATAECREERLSLRNLFTTTAAVAIVLAAGRSLGAAGVELDAVSLLAWTSAISIPSLIVMVLFLRGRPSYFGWLAALVIGVAWGNCLYFRLRGGLFTYFLTYSIVALPTAAATFIAIGFALLRGFGWRLRTRRDDRCTGLPREYGEDVARE